MLPMLLLFGLAIAGIKLGQSRSNPNQVVVSGSGHNRTRTGVIRVEQSNHPSLRFRKLLKERVVAKAPITRWLVDNAMLEAFNNGDMETVAMLSSAFGKRKRPAPASEKHASEEHASEEQAGTDEDADGEVDGEAGEDGEDGEGNEETQSGSPTELESLGQPSLKSPLDGVADEDWMDFVSRLRTKTPGFKSDKYLGQYEQNRSRLKQLNLPEPATSDEEYATLVKDISNHAQDSAELMKSWSGDVIQVNGTDHPVCASGVLGLLKYAGPDGAKSWLTNAQDRAKYPKTTEAFLRTNNCF